MFRSVLHMNLTAVSHVDLVNKNIQKQSKHEAKKNKDGDTKTSNSSLKKGPVNMKLSGCSTHPPAVVMLLTPDWCTELCDITCFQTKKRPKSKNNFVKDSIKHKIISANS